MNTIRSVGYGWGVLCLAGGGAYYFAKRSVNADRAERAAAEEQRRQQRERLRVVEASTRESKLGGAGPAASSSTKPKSKSSKPAPNAAPSPAPDPAPVEHQVTEKSRFEASEPFRSRKGDRFS